jgi:hypothetical protein
MPKWVNFKALNLMSIAVDMCAQLRSVSKYPHDIIRLKRTNRIGNFVSKEGLGFSNGFQTKLGIQHSTHIPIWGFYGDDCYL